jgi:hypothetical protein
LVLLAKVGYPCMIVSPTGFFSVGLVTRVKVCCYQCLRMIVSPTGFFSVEPVFSTIEPVVLKV